MKTKGNSKKNRPGYVSMNLRDSERSSETPDFSQLRKPVDINLSSLKQVVHLFEKGNDEVKAILTYECDIIYECRFCRSLFRSLANFISHKRVYCLEKHNVTLCIRTFDRAEPMYDGDSFIRPEVSVNSAYEQNCANDRILRSQSMRKEAKKDLTSVVDMLTRKQNNIFANNYDFSSVQKRHHGTVYTGSNGEHVILDVIDSEQAAYQTIVRAEDLSADGTNLLKHQAPKLETVCDQNIAIPNSENRLAVISNVGSNGERAVEEELVDEAEAAMNSDITCSFCDARFSSRKTLTFHVKSKHTHIQMSYLCPCCTSTFTNRWSVYRHLIKVHRKSNEQVRRLRSQIQGKALGKDLSKVDRARIPYSQSRSDSNGGERILERIQRCSGCSKLFERRAALASHLHICRKTGTGKIAESTRRKKTARKNPPHRVMKVSETGPGTVAVESDDKAIVVIPEESEPLITDRNDPMIPATIHSMGTESQSLLANQEPEASSMNCETEKLNFRRKVESIPVPPDVPMEISIRVKDVSSLSKDVWDQIGMSDIATDHESPSQRSPHSIISALQRQSPVAYSTDTIRDKPSTMTDVPEVIYTSIDNSRPVELSVLNTEKKLGIQYRGIHLPTVTLEKIDLPRYRGDNSGLKENISVDMVEIGTDRDEKIRETQQLHKLQCSPCNRRFMSMANLRRHFSVHMRRNRYRCRLCADFKSLLKCDIVAHCNKQHDAKNNRALLAELVLEVPITNDQYEYDEPDVKHVVAHRDDPEVIDVGSPTTLIDNAIAIDGLPKGKKKLLPIEKPIMTDVPSAPDPRKRRGRPLNSERKGRGRRRKKIVAKSRAVKHVSPPRLPDDSSEENNRLEETMDQRFTAKSNEYSCEKPTSTLDRDPELRKMVMEVIFGSTHKETSDKLPRPPNDLLVKSMQEASEETSVHRNNPESSTSITEQAMDDRTKFYVETEKYGNGNIEPPIRASENVLSEKYCSYGSRPTAEHAAKGFRDRSKYTAIQVTTPNPVVYVHDRVSSSVLSGTRLD